MDFNKIKEKISSVINDFLNNGDRSLRKKLLILTPFLIISIITAIVPMLFMVGCLAVAGIGIIALDIINKEMSFKKQRRESNVQIAKDLSNRLKENREKEEVKKIDKELSKDDYIELVISGMEEFHGTLGFSKSGINKDDLCILFGNLYDVFKEKGKESMFYDSMNIYTGFVIIDGLQRPKTIGISNFIENLDFLKLEKFSSEDIKALKGTIRRDMKEKNRNNFQNKKENIAR